MESDSKAKPGLPINGHYNSSCQSANFCNALTHCINFLTYALTR